MPRETIVLATDFSAPSADAARVAARLAGRPEDVLAVHVTVVGMAPDMAGGPGLGAMTVPVSTLGDMDLARVEEQLRSWCAEHGLAGARTRVGIGPPGSEIARIAREEDARLSVMGSTGRGRVSRMLLGSTASSLLHETDRNVLFVRAPPQPAPAPPFARTLIGASLVDEPFTRAAADLVAPFVKAGAEVVLAHVRDRSIRGMIMEPDEAEGELRKLNASLFGGRALESLAEGRPADELRRIARERACDLILLGDHNPGALERLIVGSVATSLAKEAPCSVLVVKQR